MKHFTYILTNEGKGKIIELPNKIDVGKYLYTNDGKYEVLEHTETVIIAKQIYSEYQLRKYSDDKKKICDIINKSEVGNEDWQDYLHELSNDLYSLTNK